MKLKNICLGIACIAVVSACSDKMDYHEYTSYDKDYVFSDFSRTAGFVNNIYSYLDSDLPSYQSLASACDEAEMAVTYSSVLDYTNGTLNLCGGIIRVFVPLITFWKKVKTLIFMIYAMRRIMRLR